MLDREDDRYALVGPNGQLPIQTTDQVLLRLAMLYEGECEGIAPAKAAAKLGLCRQRYYQLLHQYKEHGLEGLRPDKRGPKTNYRRTDEAVRQVIRHRCLDPDASPEVIAQKLRQCGLAISSRSVQRIIRDYGIQKKTLPVPTQEHSD